MRGRVAQLERGVIEPPSDSDVRKRAEPASFYTYLSIYSAIYVYAALPSLARRLAASAAETLAKKAAMPATPMRRSSAGPRTAHSRGGKRSCSVESEATNGCGQVSWNASQTAETRGRGQRNSEIGENGRGGRKMIGEHKTPAHMCAQLIHGFIEVRA